MSTRPIVGEALEHLVRFVAISAPIFYGVGRIYSEGFWDRIGLDPLLSQPSIDDYLYTGFFAFLGVFELKKALGASAFSMALGLVALVTILNLLFEPRIWPEVVKLFERWVGSFGRATIVVSVVGWLWLASALMTVGALKLGENRANEVTTAFQRGEAKRGTAEFLDGQRTKRMASVLQCGSRWCFLFIDGKFNAVPVESVLSIQQSPHRAPSSTKPRSTSAARPTSPPRP